MHVFVTGASGFIGSAVVAELVAAGHEVTGLARSEESAAAVKDLGAAVHRGDLDDLDSIRQAAGAADGVVHLANKHDFANPEASSRAERISVETISEALAGSDRPFVLASGTALAGQSGMGRPATERDRNPAVGPDSPRGGAENLGLEYVEKGVRVLPARFAPTVHGEGDRGFIAIIAQAARRLGAVPYVGDGANRWPAVHRSDAARLVRLGLERAPAGTNLHAAAEEGVPFREIAEALADRLAVPATSASAEQVADQIPFVGQFVGADIPATSTVTRDLLDWQPTDPTLLEDIAAGHSTSSKAPGPPTGRGREVRLVREARNPPQVRSRLWWISHTAARPHHPSAPFRLGTADTGDSSRQRAQDAQEKRGSQ